MPREPSTEIAKKRGNWLIGWEFNYAVKIEKNMWIMRVGWKIRWRQRFTFLKFIFIFLRFEGRDWTWGDVAEKVKWTARPLSHSLLRLDSSAADKLAVQSFNCKRLNFALSYCTMRDWRCYQCIFLDILLRTTIRVLSLIVTFPTVNNNHFRHSTLHGRPAVEARRNTDCLCVSAADYVQKTRGDARRDLLSDHQADHKQQESGVSCSEIAYLKIDRWGF